MNPLDKPTMAALLRIAIQSFDSGGESMRSLRAQAIETVWHSLFDLNDPAFMEANKTCDQDPREFIGTARRSVFTDHGQQASEKK